MNYYILLNTSSRESVLIPSHGYEKSINVGKNSITTKERQFISGCDVSKVLPGIIISFETSQLEWKIGLPWANRRGILNSLS